MEGIYTIIIGFMMHFVSIVHFVSNGIMISERAKGMNKNLHTYCIQAIRKVAIDSYVQNYHLFFCLKLKLLKRNII